MPRQKASRVQDPQAEREAQRYERPIPSREVILQVLSDSTGPMAFEPLADQLGLTEEVDLEALQRRLRAMERDGQIVRNRRNAYLPSKKADLVRGRVVGHPDGYGFLIPDEGGDDLFLSPKQMRSLLHGDRALARVVGIDRRGRREGTLVEVLERNTHQVVGRLFQEKGINYVVPDNRRLHQDVLIPPEQADAAASDQIVVAEIVEQPSRRTQPIGRVVEVLGEHMAPGMEIDIALRSHELPHEWPEAVTEAARALGDEVPEKAKRGRWDLRETPLVTIDGEDARDFDDAVYAERTDKGWRLLVAIADVASYVRPEEALDAEAQRRGTSVYFPQRVIPMLPEELSNGLCSLNPDVDRLCMVCEMDIDRRGRLRHYRFARGVMRSAARLTYTEVAQMVVEGKRAVRERYDHVVEHLDELYELYKAFRVARQRRGAIDFETTESRFIFDEHAKIERIVAEERNDAHKIIEECMITANVAAARFLQAHELPTLYRVHEGPESEKLEQVREFLGQLGLSLGGGEEPDPKDYARVINEVYERADAHLIHTVLLRSLSRAVYAPENVGHFGLALDAYAHFTSPIRRYPDLLVHRGIQHILDGGTVQGFHYEHEDMVGLGEHCSMTERRADDATRDVADWLKCEYMLEKVGMELDGLITGVTSFGLFVELDGIFIDGLLHVTSLENDYYQFDPVAHELRGERSGRVYRLGDPIRVQVARVDLDERKIDFELAEAERGRRPQRRRRAPAKKKVAKKKAKQQ